MQAWEFWIDVGGTFTDCLGRAPDGRLVRHKLLSSGVTKGAVGEGSTAETVLDPRRCGDPAGFWTGQRLRLLEAGGRVTAERRIARFDHRTGRLEVASPLPSAPSPGAAYELITADEAPVLGIRWLLSCPPGQPLPPLRVRLGTTRGTNALLTRQGARTAFVTTDGFGDCLRIGDQARPRLFELEIRKPAELYADVLEVKERVTTDGRVLTPLDEEAARAGLRRLRQAGIESLAVCLLNAWANPVHEQRIGRLAGECGFEEISLSHAVAPVIKLVARGDTTVADAYLNPVLRDYVATLRRALGPDRPLQLLTSAGGVVNTEDFSGKDSLLSGPAGGVVGFSRAAQAAGFQRAIGFDMGGTSTDVSRFDGEYEYEYETTKAGVRIVAPMMAIETVAAGGGSVCRFDGVKLAVGPASAGAEPGPAAYGRGGPLAVTDVNIFLGRLPEELFPFPLDRPAIERRLAEIRDEVHAATGRRYALAELAEGFVEVANAHMARAIRTVSVARGCDPRDYLLVAFGGAAGQHACAVARELGMRQVLIHPDAGILSARGVGGAAITRHAARSFHRRWGPDVLPALAAAFDELEREPRAAVEAEGFTAGQITVRRRLDLRYAGLDACLTVAQPESGDWRAAYEMEHQRLYGYIRPGQPLEVAALRVEVIGRMPTMPDPELPAGLPAARPARHGRARFDGVERAVPVYLREHLSRDQEIEGPAIVCEPRATTVIEPGWRARVLARGELLIGDEGRPTPEARPERAAADDPVQLELYHHRFSAIAEQMGVTLQQTATSVNVKERLDFSCAIFTSEGDLVVNAPHIPVHLGAMSETVKAVIADNPDLAPGDVFVTNDPFRGGSHLPDVTVVTPVHDPADERLLCFTASRAHHAEIGGIRPGSMPPASTSLAEEGKLIRNFKLFAAGASRFDQLKDLLLTPPWPTRSVRDNLADIQAQVAANRQGARDLLVLIERRSRDAVLAYMRHLQSAAERKMRRALAALPDGRRHFTDALDDGSPVAVTVTIRDDEAEIDFTGSAPVHPGNLNANRAIVTAGVLYVLRCLLAEDVPLNQGVLAPVRLRVPIGLLNPPADPEPARCPAVVGGNVETSQRLVDVLLGALGRAAASQGTMNNLLFGNADFGYYETIAGGAGATPHAPGADAVHTHMTNTRLTDPEVLEQRLPARVIACSIRRGSGGAGRHRGGDGMIRRIEFLAPLQVSLLMQRRGGRRPFGLAGGHPAKGGRNRLYPVDGSVQELPGIAQVDVQPGDQLCIETPGGGGWGAPAMKPPTRPDPADGHSLPEVSA